MNRDELRDAAVEFMRISDAPTDDVRELAPGVMTALDPRDKNLVFFFDGEVMRFSTSGVAELERVGMNFGELKELSSSDNSNACMFAPQFIFPTDWDDAYEMAGRHVLIRDGSPIRWHDSPIRLV